MFVSPRKAPPGVFLPEEFVVPTLVAGPRFMIRPITVSDVVKDYGAVIGSLDRLAGRFGPEWGWPDREFTFEQALIDVAWLQKEGQLRRSFSYVVTTPDGESQLGRIHVAPSDTPDADAVIVFWVRADEENSALEEELEDFVRQWATTAWPFENVRFPGRDGADPEACGERPAAAVRAEPSVEKDAAKDAARSAAKDSAANVVADAVADEARPSAGTRAVSRGGVRGLRGSVRSPGRRGRQGRS